MKNIIIRDFDTDHQVECYMKKISKANPLYSARDMRNIERAYREGIHFTKVFNKLANESY